MLRTSRASTHELNRQHRQRSTSQTSLVDGQTDRRQTYGGLRRSTSSSNLRTPRRTQARSPGNRTPSNATNTLISNSEQNRRMAAENTMKVMELIQSSRTFFKSLNLGNNGLKSMTINQFIDIISFLMVKIGGKNTITKIRNNHESVILNFLQAINYPYNVNKTCFKTPNAHHSFPEIMGILGFLCDLVREIKQFAVPTEMPLMHCDLLINDKFTRLFAAEALRNYIDYKPPREELLDEEAEQKLVNGLVAIKMKFDGLTVDELNTKADLLRKSSEELQQKLITSDIDKYFNSIEEQFAVKENEYQKLQEALIEKRKLLKMVTLSHDERSRNLHKKHAEIKEIMYQIKHQNYSISDIKQLILKETSIKSAITMIQQEKEVIEAEAADAQVKLARLQKLKLDIIKKFNDFTYKITKNLMQTHPFKNINVIELTIDPTATGNDIQNACFRLIQLNEKCIVAKKEYMDKIKQNEQKLEEYKGQFSQLNENYKEKMTKYQQFNKQLDEQNQKLIEFKANGSANNAKLQREIEEKITHKKQIDEEIDNLKNRIVFLEKENIRIFEDGERQAIQIIQEKQQLCKKLDEINEFIDDHTDNI